ncbi:hypothetical protein O181_045728 [Austropuccinia psidii MF-1]|uniref:DNA polymerase eta n=1 Tax=Austropuccinia psidii MF-1 TaxID=1389203 RepID=A0A9Q3DQV8_9BASI|nr:hypothetical protein [Austropuccinia psidii MF-1]
MDVAQTQTAQPLVTYRQLHSATIPPQHPLRVIAHCDIDAAYAQFEQVRLKIPPDKPLAVQQWRGLIAVNYPARAFGIQRHLDCDEAKKKCPDLICVHVATYAHAQAETQAQYHLNPKPETHKVSLDPYRRESIKILKIFAESCPTIEKASIDEAYLDFSLPVRDILCSRYPQLLSFNDLQKSSSSVSLDDPLPPPPQIDWQNLSQNSKSNIIQVSSHNNLTTWSDLALLIGAELMANCRQAVFDQLGYTCSAGIATNKILAKLCSAYKKPNSQTLLRQAAIRDFLRPFEISKVRSLGGKLGQSVNDLLISLNQSSSTSYTLGDVWRVSLTQLQAHLGEENGMSVWELVRGIDKSQVEPKIQVKSMMSCKNFRPFISNWDQGIHWLRILATDLYTRLTEAQRETPGIWPKTIVMHKRDISYNSTAKQIAFPSTSHLTLDYILGFGQKLLQEFSPRSADPAATFQLGKLTSLGLAFQNFDRLESGQRTIQGFFSKSDRDLEKSLEDQDLVVTSQPTKLLTSKPSSKSLIQSSNQNQENHKTLIQSTHLQIKSPIRDRDSDSISATKKRKKNLTEFFSKSNESLDCTTNPTIKTENDDEHQSALKFSCTRCKNVIEVKWKEDKDDHDRKLEFERQKTEHEDSHFARDLWQETRHQATCIQNPKPSNQSPKAKGKEKKKAKISSFFKPIAQDSGKEN